MKKILQFSMLLLFGSLLSFAQTSLKSTNFKCSISHSSDRNNVSPADTHQTIISVPSSVTNFCVRLRLHKITRENGSGGSSDAQILSTLGGLNALFDFPDSSENITFNYDTSINVIADDDIFNSNINNDASFNFSDLPSNDAIDIYFLNKTLVTPDGVAYNAVADGIADGTNILVGNTVSSSKTIAHEIGHVLGLFHPYHSTFGSGAEGQPGTENNDGYGSHTSLVECAGPQGNASKGDFIYDTPADIGGNDPLINNCEFGPYDFNPNCVTTGPSDVYHPDASNLMRTSADFTTCANTFTTYQGFRMKAILANATASDFSHIAITLCENQNCDSAVDDATKMISSLKCYPLGQPYPYRIDIPLNVSSPFTPYSEVKIVTNSGQEIDLMTAPEVGQNVRQFRVHLYQDLFEEATLELYDVNAQLCLEKTFDFDGPCRSGSDDSPLYPNPVKAHFESLISIQTEANVVEIYDINGNIQGKEWIKNNKFKLCVEKSGLYIIRGFDHKGNLIFNKKLQVN